MLNEEEIIGLLSSPERKASNPLFIVPSPYKKEVLDGKAPASGSASVDLRLGTWFLVAQLTKVHVNEISLPSRLDVELGRLRRQGVISEDAEKSLKQRLAVSPNKAAKSLHVRFGDDFILHPRAFALASTLEWLRMPSDLGGYVTGKSSLGRRGLVIATAVGVHPGFTGCLTLELTNLGDIPIIIRPGMTIAQLFLHKVTGPSDPAKIDKTAFLCKRRPVLGDLAEDETATMLSNAYRTD